MKFLDRTSDLTRVPEMRGNIRRILENRRIFDSDQEEPPYVTQSLKYDSRKKKQAIEVDTPLSGFAENVNNIVFNHDTPYRFQKRSWETIDEAHSSVETEGVLITAPTGLGKTSAFTDPLLYKLCEQDDFEQVVMVYPRTALLRDQFGNLLKDIYELNNGGYDLSIGVWYGGTERNKKEVTEAKQLVDQRNDEFQLANCWKDELGSASPLLLESEGNGYQITCQNPSHNHQLTDDDVLLYREGIRNAKPNIIITTLESLELFSIKPNYSIIQNIDAVVFDEVHLYRGLYGAHAQKVIENIGAVCDHHKKDMPLLIGASATLANPSQFGRKLFGIEDEDDLEVINASHTEETTEEEKADVEDADGKEHFQFLRTAEDVGVGSHFIQQSMLYGHRILPEKDSEGQMLSFIDSLSQINQRFGQIKDADSNLALWRYHSTGSEYTWRDLEEEHAWNTDTDNFKLEPLQIDKAHSGSRLRPNQLAQSDMILSSPLLEVGIDLSEIQAVAQYRPPWNASSFIQRIGRAGRNPDEDSYILMFLGDQPNDRNLYYRASRFLETEITTPLNVNNKVVNSIHSKFKKFYECSEPLDLGQGDDREFLREYLCGVLKYDSFYEFVMSPSSEIEDIVGKPIGKIEGPLTGWETYSSVEDRLEEMNSDIRDQLSLDDNDGITQKTESFDEITEDIEYVLEGYKNLLGRLESNDKYAKKANEFIENCRNCLRKADTIPVEDAEDKTDTLREAVSNLQRINSHLTMVTDVGRSVRNDAKKYDEQSYEILNTIDDLTTQVQSDEFDKLHKQSRKVYYLRKSVEAFKPNIWIPYAHSSLHAVKALLRSAYYFNQALKIDRDSMVDEMYLVPENYFGGGGSSVSIKKGNKSKEEPKTKLLSQYAPYKPKYADNGREMIIFAPNFDPDEDPRTFDLKTVAHGEIEKGVLEPESIKTKRVKDESGRRSQGIVRYCPICYDLITESEECGKHGKRQYGKIHSDPHIKTEFGKHEHQEDNETGVGQEDKNLVYRRGEGRIILSHVKLEFTPAYFQDNRYVPRYDHQDTFKVRSENPRLGITFQTEGIELDISKLMNEVRESSEEWASYVVGDREADIEEIVRHTAAHFLLVLVADVAGTNPRDLHYGYRDEDSELESDTVYVFEQTEGGQGTVRLLIDEIEDNNVDRIYKSLSRVVFNEQLEAERFCRQKARLESIVPQTDDDLSEEDLEDAVSDYLGDREIVSSSRLSEELRSIVSKIIAISDKYGVSREEVIGLKSELSTSRYNDKSIDEAMHKHASQYHDSLQNEVKSSLCPPDIDECVNNLQISGCCAESQEDVLSYNVLHEIVKKFIPDDGSAQELFEYES